MEEGAPLKRVNPRRGLRRQIRVGLGVAIASERLLCVYCLYCKIVLESGARAEHTGKVS